MEFVCDMCHKILSSPGNLSRHLRTVHDEFRDLQLEFKCDICLKCFSKKGNLNAHKKIHEGKNLVKCIKCPKYFASQFSAQRHQKTHQNIKKSLECQFCGRVFIRKAKYDNHIELHQLLFLIDSKLTVA